MKDIIFLSAQPDDFYFLWQIEVLLHNLNELKVPSSNIHVLIGFSKKKGLKEEARDLIKKNKNVQFFIYPDIRENKLYASSIRPNLIKQHFKKYPELNNRRIFYHDSDIIFRELPDFDKMPNNNEWLVSDTRSYLDSHYIKRCIGEDAFINMCNIIGIAPETIIENDRNAGGAQYLLDSLNFEFWNKVEYDCEKMFRYLTEINNKNSEFFSIKTGKIKSEYHGIQAWCTDMWVILWNGLLLNKKILIHNELDFSWPYEHINEWYKKKILHNSGVKMNKSMAIFCKGEYLEYSPFYKNDFKSIDQKKCSVKYVEALKKARYADHTVELLDVSFLISIRIDSEDRMSNLLIVLNYLNKHFKTVVLILESDDKQKIFIDKNDFSNINIIYEFRFDPCPIFHHTKINNRLIKKSSTPIICIYDSDVVLPVSQIIDAITLLRKDICEVAYPYDGNFLGIDRLFKELFSGILNTDLLAQNIGKLPGGSKRSFGGAVFLKREFYIHAGMDNENIDSWGPEDIERAKRAEILGGKLKRVNGPLFHLPHKRHSNSSYINLETRAKHMCEYLRVCGMKKEELLSYISLWHWIN